MQAMEDRMAATQARIKRAMALMDETQKLDDKAEEKFEKVKAKAENLTQQVIQMYMHSKGKTMPKNN